MSESKLKNLRQRLQQKGMARDVPRNEAPRETPAQVNHYNNGTHCFLELSPPGTQFVKMTPEQYWHCIKTMTENVTDLEATQAKKAKS